MHKNGTHFEAALFKVSLHSLAEIGDIRGIKEREHVKMIEHRFMHVFYAE